MSETTRNFISNIKVKGINLLPPLITEKMRLELQRYKHQAIKLEKRLQNCRELTKNLNELLNFESLSNRPQSVRLKGDIYVETLHVRDDSSVSNNSSKRRLNLTRDIIDVTEYNNEGIRIINSESDMNNDLNQGHQLNQNCSSKAYETDTSLNESSKIRLSHPTINKEDINTCPDNHSCQVLDLSRSIESGMAQEENISLKNYCSDTINTLRNISPLNYEKPRPRLIRSNSYTLETPSPILLAHLEKCHKKEEQENTQQSKKPNFTKNWSSLESNYVPFENSEFSSINTVYKNDQIFSGEKIESPMTENAENRIENSKSPTIEVIQTDISVQQITVNTNKEENELLKTTLDLADPDSQLMQVLKNIPEDYSKQIIELIEKQRLEHKKRTECFRRVERPDDTPTKHANLPNINTSRNQMDGQNKLHADNNLSICGHENNIQGGTPHSATNSTEIQENEFFCDSTICPSPSQSVHYNMSSSDTLIPSSPFMELNELGDDVNINISDELYTAEKSHGLIHLYLPEDSRKKSFSKELFPQIEAAKMNTIKQEWAARIIGAHVKGYLTRRLLKTERVESLIDTIKDALLCALQLHNSDNIDESDVELHRRLINQVSAACYAFHDIFFTLSIPEQMMMISKDRQRKIEKAKRPTSAPTPRRSRSTSSRSSAKRLTPHSQSLTKV